MVDFLSGFLSTIVVCLVDFVIEGKCDFKVKKGQIFITAKKFENNKSFIKFTCSSFVGDFFGIYLLNYLKSFNLFILWKKLILVDFYIGLMHNS